MIQSHAFNFSHETIATKPKNKNPSNINRYAESQSIRAELNCIVKNAFEMEVGVYLRLNL